MDRLFSPHNRLLEGARSAQRVPYAMFAMLFSVIAVFGAAIFGSAATRMLASRVLGEEEAISQSATLSGIHQCVGESFQWLPCLFILWVMVRFVERREFRTIGFVDAHPFRKFFTGAFVGFSMMACWAIVAYLLGGVVLEDSLPQQAGSAALLGVLITGAGVLLQGPSEEIVFRGWLLPVVGARWKPILGLVLPGILFGVIHVTNDADSTFSLFNIALFGIFFGLYALYEESIWGVMGFHWMYNWTQFNLLGLRVSPEDTRGGAIINLAYTSDAPFATTGVVAEDSLLMTVMMSLGCIALVGLAVRRKSRETAAN